MWRCLRTDDVSWGSWCAWAKGRPLKLVGGDFKIHTNTFKIQVDSSLHTSGRCYCRRWVRQVVSASLKGFRQTYAQRVHKQIFQKVARDLLGALSNSYRCWREHEGNVTECGQAHILSTQRHLPFWLLDTDYQTRETDWAFPHHYEQLDIFWWWKQGLWIYSMFNLTVKSSFSHWWRSHPCKPGRMGLNFTV